jgi:DNA-binding CsgD family transcriptional regulator
MKNNINMSQMVLNISKLNLGQKIESILVSNNILYLTDISQLNEESLKNIPGIGYASARKIFKAYNSYVDSIMKHEPVCITQANKVIAEEKNSIDITMHSLLAKSNLKKQDKEILNLMIHGYSQQQVGSLSGISQRTLRHRLAMLKIEYQAITLTQLVCNVFDDVLMLDENK